MKRSLVVVFMLLGSVIAARATTIDFETGSFVITTGNVGTLEGFNFTAGGPPGATIVVPITAGTNCGPPCVSDGTNTMGIFNDANVTMAPIGGEIFRLSSFDAAGTFMGSSRNVTSLEVIGYLSGGGQVTQTFSITNPEAFATFSLPSSFTNLTAAGFFGLQPTGPFSPEFQLDNIVVNPVPEPSSLLLLATGVFGLGGSLKRKFCSGVARSRVRS